MKVTLALGDIVRIDAPRNSDLNQQLFYILFLSEKVAHLVNISTFVTHKLAFSSSNTFTDESIERVLVLHRNKERGFARQHGLLPGVYVNLSFGGELPSVVTGKITNLENDMVEVTTIPEKQVLYIDFAYQGIPPTIPLTRIDIRDAPKIKPHKETDEDDTTGTSPLDDRTLFLPEGDSSVTFREAGEMVVSGTEDAIAQSVHDVLESLYAEADRLNPDGAFSGSNNNDVMNDLLDHLSSGSSESAHRLCLRFQELRSLKAKTTPTSSSFSPKLWAQCVVSSNNVLSPIVSPTSSCEAVIDDFSMLQERYWTIHSSLSNEPCRFVTRRFLEGEPMAVKSWLFLSPGSLPLSLWEKHPLLADAVEREPLLWSRKHTDLPLEEFESEFKADTLYSSDTLPSPTWESAGSMVNRGWSLFRIVQVAKDLGIKPGYAEMVSLLKSGIDSYAKRHHSANNLFSSVDPIRKTIRFEDASVETTYRETYHHMSAASDEENLVSVWRQDAGALLAALLQQVTIPVLRLSEDMMKATTANDQYEDLNQVGTIKAESLCARRVLAKRYTTLKDIHKDSHHGKEPRPIFFDSEYDETPYELLETYRNQLPQGDEGKFIEFLTHVLIDKHNYHPHMAKDVASHIIAKKRPVRDGEFALLDNQREPFYYRRTKDHNWVLDKTVDATSFIDTPTLFSNLDKVSMREAKATMCENPADVQARLRYLDQRRTLREVDSRVTSHMVHTLEALEQRAARIRILLRRRQALDHMELHRFTEFHFALGQRATKEAADDEAEAASSSVCPHVALRDRIVGLRRDPAKRSQLILDFANRHCREACDGESPGWFYCNQTVPAYPLLPRFFVDLASGADLDLLRNRQGVPEEGRFVDTFSGYTITERWSSSSTRPRGDDGYDCGYDESCVRIDCPPSELITSLFRLLEKKMGVSLPFEGLRLANTLIQSLPSEKVYAQDQSSGSTPFDVFLHRECILRAACAILFTVQTSQNVLKQSATFAGCASNFQGYPLLDDESKQSGLKFMSGILAKLTSHSVTPWNALRGWTANLIQQALLLRIQQSILTREDCQRALRMARRPLAETAAPRPLWMLPPALPLHLKTEMPLPEDTRAHLMKLFHSANTAQHELLGSIRAKCAWYGWNAFESSTSSFAPAQLWQTLLDEVTRKERPVTLTYVQPVFKTSTTSTVAPGYRKDTAYAAFIWYTNLDSLMPTPDILREYLPQHLEGYDPTLPLVEKIKFLEDNHVNLDANKMRDMMNQVHKKVQVSLHKKTNPLLAARDLFTNATTLQVFDASLCSQFVELLGELKDTKDEEDAFEDEFMQNLAIFNLNVVHEIFEFFQGPTEAVRSVLLIDQLITLRGLVDRFSRFYPEILCNDFGVPPSLAVFCHPSYHPLLRHVQTRLTCAIPALDVLPTANMDPRLTVLFYKFVLFTVIQEYIRTCDSPELRHVSQRAQDDPDDLTTVDLCEEERGDFQCRLRNLLLNLFENEALCK
jgi:hypothetical protein